MRNKYLVDIYINFPPPQDVSYKIQRRGIKDRFEKETRVPGEINESFTEVIFRGVRASTATAFFLGNSENFNIEAKKVEANGEVD